jgi:hypothetical protein
MRDIIFDESLFYDLTELDLDQLREDLQHTIEILDIPPSIVQQAETLLEDIDKIDREGLALNLRHKYLQTYSYWHLKILQGLHSLQNSFKTTTLTLYGPDGHQRPLTNEISSLRV